MNESPHKFDTPISGITYRQYLTDACAGRIVLIRELEGILGKKRTHEIVERHYTHAAIESCKKLVASQETPLDTIEDIKNLFEKLKESEFSQNTQTDFFLDSEPGTLRF